MGGPDFWARFALAILAAWRVAHLLVAEDGPGGVIAWVRGRLGQSIIGQMMDCFGCAGLWVAAPLAWFVGGRIPGLSELIGSWLAIAGAAYLLELFLPTPIHIQPQEIDNGLL